MLNIIPSCHVIKGECDSDQVDRLPVKKRKVSNNYSETSSQECSSDDDDINANILFGGDFYGDINDFQDLLNLPSTGKRRGTSGSPSSSSDKSNTSEKKKKIPTSKSQPKAPRQVHSRSVVDGKWEKMYTLLMAFEAQHGHCKFPLSLKVKDVEGKDVNLGLWLGTQRQLRRKNQLCDHKLLRLQALADAGKLEWGANKVSADEERWERFFHHLLLFCDAHGHCNVPNKFEMFVNPSAKLSPNSPQGTDDENDLGEEMSREWDGEETGNAPQTTTTTNTNTTSAFSTTPSSTATECVKLGRWLDKQRRAMRRGDLRADRLEKLQDLMDRGLMVMNSIEEDHRRWHMFYEALLRYGETHGHCNVPHRFEVMVSAGVGSRVAPSSSGGAVSSTPVTPESSQQFNPNYTPTNNHMNNITNNNNSKTIKLKLGVWLTAQRHLCKKKNGVVKIRPERLSQLQLLVGRGLLKLGEIKQDKEVKWNQTYQALLCYELEPNQIYNDISRSASAQVGDGWFYSTQVKLHAWLHQQLLHASVGKLLPHRRALLQELVDNGSLRWDLPPSEDSTDRARDDNIQRVGSETEDSLTGGGGGQLSQNSSNGSFVSSQYQTTDYCLQPTDVHQLGDPQLWGMYHNRQYQTLHPPFGYFPPDTGGSSQSIVAAAQHQQMFAAPFGSSVSVASGVNYLPYGHIDPQQVQQTLQQQQYFQSSSFLQQQHQQQQHHNYFDPHLMQQSINSQQLADGESDDDDFDLADFVDADEEEALRLGEGGVGSGQSIIAAAGFDLNDLIYSITPPHSLSAVNLNAMV